MRATDSAADMATRHKSRRDVLEGVQDMDVDFTAGAFLPKGTAKRRPGEREHKQGAFKFQANDVKVPTSRPPTSISLASALNLAQGVTATVDVEQLENEVRGVISDVPVLKDSVASLEHSEVKGDVYMEMLLQAQGLLLDQAKSCIEAGKQHLRLSQQHRGLFTPSAPPTTHEHPPKSTNLAKASPQPRAEGLVGPSPQQGKDHAAIEVEDLFQSDSSQRTCKREIMEGDAQPSLVMISTMNPRDAKPF